MSVYTENPQKANERDKPCKGIERILDARKTDLGGFGVRRVLPSSHQQMIGPWIFFDHFGPNTFEPGKGVDVRPHPHINMATVTYMFEGQFLHQDSTSVVQNISPGAVNLMFAGRGIVHSERTPPEDRKNAHTIHGLQLWLAMPEELEQNPPEFFHYPSDDIPHFQQGDVEGRVIMGQAYGASSPVKAFSPTLYFEARMPKGSNLTLPKESQELGVYVVDGQIKSGDTTIDHSSMAISTNHEGIEIEATQDTQIAVIGGEPLGKRYIWWNFVSSDPNRIDQAAQDWRNNKFQEIPTDREEFIPVPEK